MYLRRKCYSSLYDDLYNDYLYEKCYSDAYDYYTRLFSDDDLTFNFEQRMFGRRNRNKGGKKPSKVTSNRTKQIASVVKSSSAPARLALPPASTAAQLALPPASTAIPLPASLPRPGSFVQPNLEKMHVDDMMSNLRETELKNHNDQVLADILAIKNEKAAPRPVYMDEAALAENNRRIAEEATNKAKEDALVDTSKKLAEQAENNKKVVEAAVNKAKEDALEDTNRKLAEQAESNFETLKRMSSSHRKKYNALKEEMNSGVLGWVRRNKKLAGVLGAGTGIGLLGAGTAIGRRTNRTNIN